MVDARALAFADLAGCMALSSEAGWNQTEDDWKLILEHGRGHGLFDGSRLIASAAIMPYGERFGWICMVLVAIDERRKGHATRLMRCTLSTLQAMRLVPGLDATADGREVYARLGFSDVYRITRLRADWRASGLADKVGARVRPIGDAEFAAVAAYDAAAFGAGRERLLAALRSRRPDLALAAGLVDIEGFLLARDGRLATQLGPLVADDDGTARALLSRALQRVTGPLIIDLADRHAVTRAWLESLGFTAERSFTRMLLGRTRPFDVPDRIVAVAGPELA